MTAQDDKAEIRRLRAALRHAATYFAEIIGDSRAGELSRPYFKTAQKGLIVCRQAAESPTVYEHVVYPIGTITGEAKAAADEGLRRAFLRPGDEPAPLNKRRRP
jgi:hypothetical protein